MTLKFTYQGTMNQIHKQDLKRLYRHVKVLIRDVFQADIPLQASSMSYASLGAVIPSLAVIFSIIALFQPIARSDTAWFRDFKVYILKNLAPNTAQDLVGKIESLLDNIDITKIGVVGFITLFVIVIFLLQNIEIAFNRVWQVGVTRSWYRSFLFFWLSITLGGVCLSVFISVLSKAGVDFLLPFLSKDGALWSTILSEIVNFALIFGFFFVFHKVVPNCRVSKRAAFVGGLSATILIRAASIGFGVYTAYSRWNQDIYAALSVVPIFLLWLYVVWIVVLISAVLAWRTDFGMSAARVGEIESGVFPSIKYEYRDNQIRALLPFIIYRLVSEKFETAHAEGLSCRELARTLELPPSWLKEALDICLKNSFVVMANDDIEKISDHKLWLEGRLFPAVPLAEFAWGESLRKVSADTEAWLAI
ncbi:MAG: YihY family inner membrane protein, partial [Proteobacteria bacterium]